MTRTTTELDPADRPDPRPVGRRGLLFGAGAATAAAATAALGITAAPALASDRRRGASSAAIKPDATTVGTTLASPAISGYVYRHASMFDFSVEDGSVIRYWGGRGVYAADSALHATIEIPSGARLRDFEWYVSNGTGANVTASARLWLAGDGFLGSSAGEATIAPGSDVTATRLAAPSANFGPYPLGTKLDLTVLGQGSALQVNGVRVGFDVGGGELGLLPAPVRAYDSRTHGHEFHAGETRTITLPAVVAPGAVGAILNVTAVGATRNGYLKVYPASAPEPSASAMNFTSSGQAIANGMTIGVSNHRQIKIKASKAVHVIVDVTGIVA